MRRHLALLSLTVFIGCAEAPDDWENPLPEDGSELDSGFTVTPTPDASTPVNTTADASVPQYPSGDYDSGTPSSSYDSGTSSTSSDSGTSTGTGQPTDFLGQLLGTFTGFLGGGAKDGGTSDGGP